MELLNQMSSIFIILSMVIMMSLASVKTRTVLVGSSVEVSCLSSFVPPFWSWVGPKQNKPKTLAFSGTQPHPNLEDERFSFSKEDSIYFLRISSLKSTDAGTINCHGDSLRQTLLNVLR